MDCPYKVYVFVDQKFTKETRCLKVSKRACPYIWYTLFIVHLYFLFFEDFFNAFLNKKKSLAVTCITLSYNYYRFLHKRGQKGGIKQIET